jgi:catechol 2,3-dioxygenase-like lactoylglutathione lyase family enzyme
MAHPSPSSITLYVRAFERMVEFYRDRLGLEVEQFRDGFVRFRAESGFALAFQYADQPVLPRPVPEIRFMVPDVDTAYQGLQARGVRFEAEPADTPEGTRRAACHDPEGFSVEFVGPPKHTG